MRSCLVPVILLAVAVINGKASKIEDKRIYGGEKAELGQFPYQVLIYAAVHVNETCCGMRCGGALIDEFWVLTAAHCFPKSFHHVELKIGVISNTWSVWETYVGRQSVKIHQNYSSSQFVNDIALIKVPKAKFGLLNYPYVDVIGLPKMDDDFVGVNATVSGFGRTESGASDVLRFVDLPVMENSECSKVYSNIQIMDSHVCGRTTPTTGMCFGDSGGPYAVIDPERRKYILAGIVSFGTADCKSGYPDVFTRVSNYLDWIEEVMQANLSSKISYGIYLLMLVQIVVVILL